MKKDSCQWSECKLFIEKYNYISYHFTHALIPISKKYTLSILTYLSNTWNKDVLRRYNYDIRMHYNNVPFIALLLNLNLILFNI